MPFIECNGTKINYSQISHKGEGEVKDLVMVHGLAANMAYWLDDYASHFSQNFRVTLFDLRGHGRSKTTKDGYKPDNLARDLKGLLDNIEINQAHFVAHSFGGVVAMNFAFNNPDRVKSLVLADTQINEGRALLKQTSWTSANPLKDVLKVCNIDINTSHPYFGYYLITEVAKMRVNDIEIPEVLAPWVQRIFDGSSKRSAEKWLDLIENTSAFEELTAADNLSPNNLYKIKCPILAIFGENSHSMATAGFINNIWKHVQNVSIAEAGHFFPKSCPDVTKQLFDSFFDNGNLDKVVKGHNNVNYVYNELQTTEFS